MYLCIRKVFYFLNQTYFESLKWLIQKCLLNIIILMSNPNHIIIPIVKNKPTAEQLNVFRSPLLCLTPQKQAPLSKILVDKKYSSAFKRYKQKKDKKEHLQLANASQEPQNEAPTLQRPFRLRTRHSLPPSFNKIEQEITSAFQIKDYYDTYEAPLFVSEEGDGQPLERRTRINFEKIQRMEEEIQIQVQQKQKNEPIEQELQVKNVSLPARDDDPFIIIKKEYTKKNKNNRPDPNGKTKQIKKQSHLSNSETVKAKSKQQEQKKTNSFLSSSIQFPEPLKTFKSSSDDNRQSFILIKQEEKSQYPELHPLSNNSQIFCLGRIIIAHENDSNIDDDDDQIPSPIIFSGADIVS